MTQPTLFDISSAGKRAVRMPPCDVPERLPEELLGADALRTEPPALPDVTEPELARHYANLARKNFAIDLGFYPLGSCTMKYNPKVNERVAALPGFSRLHPLQPQETVQGALELMWELERYLCEISGFDAASLQPPAGASGEFTCMRLIQAYHEARGEGHRKRVLVPDTAHGTNPASVVRCGYVPTQIASDERGRVSVSALAKALGDDVAGIMLTNPNTLGLFEDDILQIAEMVHEAGALLYCDGANMNAIMGIARPGDMGFDSMHFNLHKTFSTPHGGGGPGGGPIAVKSHLEPYLPDPRVVCAPAARQPCVGRGCHPGQRGTVADASKPLWRRREPPHYNATSAFRVGRGCLAPPASDTSYHLEWQGEPSIGKVHAFWGNFLVAVRAYTYIRQLGAEGLRDVSETAVLNANYILAGLADTYDVPYPGRCMHECVLSALSIQQAHDVRTWDIAKRLMDYGFHPPTVYFPLIVKEAIMIEPTETESKATLEAFIEAMKTIAAEAATDPELLHNAPHTMPVRRVDEVTANREPNLRA